MMGQGDDNAGVAFRGEMMKTWDLEITHLTVGY
jgi:hypothetical protein